MRAPFKVVSIPEVAASLFLFAMVVGIITYHELKQSSTPRKHNFRPRKSASTLFQFMVGQSTMEKTRTTNNDAPAMQFESNNKRCL